MYRFDEKGFGNASIGKSSFYTDDFSVVSVEDSIVLKIDSVDLYFSKLQKIEEKPIYGSLMRDAHRIEIYSGKVKVYDSYRFDSQFWDLIHTIVLDIPEEFNPFMFKDKNLILRSTIY